MDAFLDSLPAASGIAADWSAPGGLLRQNEALVVPTQVRLGAWLARSLMAWDALALGVARAALPAAPDTAGKQPQACAHTHAYTACAPRAPLLKRLAS